MIFQDPMTSLNPVITVGDQIVEAILVHRRIGRKAAREEAVTLLEVVGIPNAAGRMSSYPHEFSGGMRQRAVIAIAMANNPDVIIADEPTTALDVTVQAQVMQALEDARKHVDAALILVTHDLGVVAGHADRVLVMYGGRVVENGAVDEVFYGSRMPYSRGLLAAIPRIDRRDARLVPIPGSPPNPRQLTGHACPFAARCDFATDLCQSSEPELETVAPSGHAAACHYANDYDRVPRDNPDLDDAFEPAGGAVDPDGRPLLEVRDLVKTYPVRQRGKARTVYAVDGVSFDVRPGETLGLVGESGCGKSSVSRSIVRLQSITSGEVSIGGDDMSGARGKKLRELRGRIQMVFQDPYSSLDPRMSVEEILIEPLRLGGYPKARRRERIEEVIGAVGLTPSVLDRYPHEFSGGQRQRLGIARALMTDPEVLVLDEPVSALDVSVQAGVINLLADLKRERGLGYLFIAHDLSIVAHISDRIAVMYLGRIIEIGESSRIFATPQHPYTKALIAAVPIPDPRRERARAYIPLEGDPASPLERTVGCAFRTRCPIYAQVLSADQREKCDTLTPELTGADADQAAACHFPDQYPLTKESTAS
jgi:peptide/nickel transport system ATP-binding protein